MEHINLQSVKIAVTGFFAALTAWMGALACPVYILIGLNLVDYFTGYTAAPYRGQARSSSVGVRGIDKKVCMLLLVVLGGVLDWLMGYAIQTVGITIPFQFFVAALVAVWLICNEIISILENIGDIGVELPPFLLRLVKWVKAGAEDKAKVPEKEERNA